MSIRCGIQLDTTYSAISWYDDDVRRVETVSLEHADGRLILPSVVYFEAGGNVVVGDAADNARTQYPDRVIAGIKRSMGDDYRTAPIDGKEYTPQEVSAEILKALKSDAEAYTDKPIKEVVISVPAYFGDRQRLATQEAGALAGLDVLELIPEPHAAALAFAIERVQDVENRHVLVYDLGGGTFDITLISTEREELAPDMTGLRITTVGKAGDWHLGGLDWDRALARLVADKAMDQHGIADPHNDPKSEVWLLKTCEQHKRQLSQLSSLSIPADMQGHAVDVTRSEFERATADLMMQTEEWTRHVLEEAERDHGLVSERRIQELEAQGTPRAELEPKKVRLLLCGGATRMPMVRDCVTRVMGEPPLQHKNPDLLVTIGAAYRAHSLAIVPGNEINILEAALGVNAEPIVKPTPPVSRKKLTATRVIEMFQALNLPVTDDAQLIRVKADELKPRYRRMKSLPDPHMRAEANAWFQDLAEVELDLDKLLGVVRDHFETLSNTALKAAREAGLTTLTPALVEDLQRLAMEECRCDPALAERFLTDYLAASNFVTGDLARSSQAGRARYSVVDIISMFRDVDLPVTDDTMHISIKIKQLLPKYRTMERSENLLEREKAAVWFKTIEVLQGDVSELIERVRDLLFLFADIELYAALSVPSIRPSRVFPSKLAQRAKQDLKCDESLARRLAREYIEQRGIEIDQRLPSYVYELEAFKIEGLPAYNAFLLKGFIVNHVDLQEFCFYLKDRLGRMYGYQALRGEDENGKVRALLERADQNDEVGEVIFELTRYWIEIERSSPKVLKSSAVHQALGIYLRKLLERDAHDRVDQVLDLLGRILS